MRNSITATLRLAAPLLFAVLAPATPIRAQATGGNDVRFEGVYGNQTVSGAAGRGYARFNEFRAVADGAVFESGRLIWAPHGRSWTLTLTGQDVGQQDQRYALRWNSPGRFTLHATYTGLGRFYSSGSTTLWSGVGTGALTLSQAYRQAVETTAGSATQPFAPAALGTLMQDAIARSGNAFDLRTQRNAAALGLDVRLSPAFALNVTGRYETRSGTRPLGIGTYIRRQALAGTPSTGAGFFWRESIEPRGSEVPEPLDQSVVEAGTALSWAAKGHSAVVGWQGSWFRNDINSLYFDNPFEADTGRASAIVFNPASDQEPGAPNGNNNLRGLYARSAIQLAPDNAYQRVYGNATLRLPARSRFSTALSYARMTQNDPFMPYSENDQVVFSGTAGQPGVVYARDAALPQAGLDGRMNVLQADFRLTSRIGRSLDARAGFRLYDLNDERPEIQFPGYSSSSDSYFRRGIGQKDSVGAKALFNEVGGYQRRRWSAGATYRLGAVAFDAEYLRTNWEYDARQVTGTSEDAFKGTVRLRAGAAGVSAHYQTAHRDYEGAYHVGLETSGVRAFDVWTRDRDQFGVGLDLPLGPSLDLTAGASLLKDRYPGAVQDTAFQYGYGLQDSKTGSVFLGLTWSGDRWSVGANGGYDVYDWNSLQVTKTGLTRDYDPVNRWTRGSSDKVLWLGVDVAGRLAPRATVRADLNYQRFAGTWETTNLGTPDVNSAVAYAFPDLKESLLTGRVSLLWSANERLGIEARYAYEPYRLTDFTWDAVQAYPQGVLQETRSSASDVGAMNASRVLWLDSRYSNYTTNVFSVLFHVKF